MLDIYIFGFGLVVTLLVGSGLSAMIIAHNRSLEEEERGTDSESGEAIPVPVRNARGKE